LSAAVTFDAQVGEEMGNRIGGHVVKTGLLPVPPATR
jgi:hypothetical protein